MLSTYSIGVHFSQTHAFIVCLDKSLSGIKVKEYDRIDLSKSNTIEQRFENLGDYLAVFIDSKGLGEPEIYISIHFYSGRVIIALFVADLEKELVNRLDLRFFGNLAGHVNSGSEF